LKSGRDPIFKIPYGPRADNFLRVLVFHSYGSKGEHDGRHGSQGLKRKGSEQDQSAPAMAERASPKTTRSFRAVVPARLLVCWASTCTASESDGATLPLRLLVLVSRSFRVDRAGVHARRMGRGTAHVALERATPAADCANPQGSGALRMLDFNLIPASA
jgi:hypothetical protein